MTDQATEPSAAETAAVFTPVTAVTRHDVTAALSRELKLPLHGVAAVVALLDDGNTVPFIARYRKERTGGLDEVQIRDIEERQLYLREMEDRRAAVLASIREQGKLTDELAAKINAATAKHVLEDLYAPFRQKRRTRAMAAREKGLEPLALRILAQEGGDANAPTTEAAAFVNAERGVATVEDAIAGARDIVADVVADTAEVRALVRRAFADDGAVVSEVVAGKGDEPTKFEQYYSFRESVKTIPSHRFLAIRRGEAEGVLRAQVVVDATLLTEHIERLMKLDAASPWSALLHASIGDAYKRLLAPSVENDIRTELKLRSDVAAVDVFADNIRNLMLSPPLGARAVVGVDPGLRTGCKCVAVDATGKFLDTVTIFLSQGDAQLAKSKTELRAFLDKHQPVAIAVGNGTGGREAEAFVRKLLAEPAAEGAAPTATRFVVAVNEAGASVYSASDLAREEFPELDLTIRGAISIARRLQDPLAELVKIEPKAIGVGQYQHDVHQPLMIKRLGDVVESCVNHVGVELNTASAQLLQYVAGIGKTLAKKIIVYRDEHGKFDSRKQLLEVSGLGPKAFEQAAGFLRINGAAHPLDSSAVHPESYALVEQMAADLGVPVASLLGNAELVATIDRSKYLSDTVGEITLNDILAELKKPTRDPRAEFTPPKFRDDVTTVEDLKPGMVIEGIVTNVTAFGAFVDIGVHQDGLVHVSQLSDKFVKDPTEVVKAGQLIKVRVLEVDLARKRIALTARAGQEQRRDNNDNRGPRGPRPDNRGPRQDNRGPRPDNRNDNRAPRQPQQQDQAGAPGPNGEQSQHQRQARPDNRGPRPDNRGPRGPRNDGPRPPHAGPPSEHPQTPGGNLNENQHRDARGPRQDNRGPDNRGPRQDNRGPDNRGPRQDNRGPDNRGPRQDNRGPDNRGPRRDDFRPEPAPPPGFGIAGFVNSPFAKLAGTEVVKGGGRKR